MTEEEVVEILERVATSLAPKWRFGYHSTEDIKQQAICEGLKAIEEEKYDETKPLENFMWIHMRNRLYNFKRNNFERPDKPCFTCPLYDPGNEKSTNQCEKYINKDDCEPYRAWNTRNSSKKNLMCPIGMSVVNDENEDSFKLLDSMGGSLETTEIIEIIDSNIQVEFRKDWLNTLYGIKLLKVKRDKLMSEISRILQEHNINVQEER